MGMSWNQLKRTAQNRVREKAAVEVLCSVLAKTKSSNATYARCTIEIFTMALPPSDWLYFLWYDII